MESDLEGFRDLVYSRYKSTSPFIWFVSACIGIALICAGPFSYPLLVNLGPHVSRSIEQILSALGGAFLSSGIIGIIFGQITRRENFAVTELAIHSVLKEIMVPIRAELLLDSYERYVWVSKLTEIVPVGSCIATWRQETQISFKIRNIPDTLILVGVTNSQLLKRYMLDDRCLLRWEIAKEFHKDLKAAFSPGTVIVNGEALSSAHTKVIGVGDDKIIEYHFHIPGKFQGALSFDVQFSFNLLRSVIPKSSHYIVPTVYRPALSSSFRLEFDLSNNPRHVTAHETGVFPLVEEKETTNVSFFDENDLKVRSHTVDLNFPIQRRSQILFELFF